MNNKLWTVKAYSVVSYVPAKQHEVTFFVPVGETPENIQSKAQAIMEREYGTRRITCSYVRELQK